MPVQDKNHPHTRNKPAATHHKVHLKPSGGKKQKCRKCGRKAKVNKFGFCKTCE